MPASRLACSDHLVPGMALPDKVPDRHREVLRSRGVLLGPKLAAFLMQRGIAAVPVVDAAAPVARAPVALAAVRLQHLFRNTPLQGAALVLSREIELFHTREPA